MTKGKLTLICGKMGAGKSTYANKLVQNSNTILLSEDEWLEALYPEQICSLNDYLKFSNLLKPQIKKLAQSILLTGTNVVMDFPANTVQQRNWLKTIYTELQAPHRLVFIDKPNKTWLAQIAKRRHEQPERAVTDTAAMFEQVTKYFVAPTQHENFEVIRITE